MGESSIKKNWPQKMGHAINELGCLDLTVALGSKSVSVLSKCKLVVRYQASNQGADTVAGI